MVQPLQKQLKSVETRTEFIKQMPSQLKQLQKQMSQVQKESQKTTLILSILWELKWNQITDSSLIFS
jgi:hypothetical protein